jgi:hypothetical protein
MFGNDFVNALKGGINTTGKILSPIGQGALDTITSAARATTKGPYDDWLNAPTAQQLSGRRNFRPDYKQKELAAGQAAENFRRGAGFPGQVSTAGAGPNGPNPNAIVQGQDGIGEEYRQRMNAYNNQAILARQSLEGYDPSKGPLPGAAQEAQDQGMDIWRGLNASTKMVQPGGAVGTFNPLMQGRGDVPSMEELWKGIGGGAPTSGPGDEAIKAAMAKGQYNAPAGSPNPFGQPANSVPAPPQQQGNAISGAFAPAQAEAAKYTAGATGMPNLPTTPEAQNPGTNFLDYAMKSPWGDALKNTLGAMFIDKVQGR